MRPSAPLLVIALLLCPSIALVQQPPFISVSHRTPTICKSSAQDDAVDRQFAPNNRASLRWVIQSIERNENNPGLPPSPELLKVIKDLEGARTQKHVMEVGRKIESMAIKDTESVFVQERIIKATAISGLISISSDLVDSLLEKGHMPSEIAYTALCKSLRQARRVTQLKELLSRLAHNAPNSPISPVALNTYLATLCDTVTRQDANNRRNLKIEDIGRLEKARTLLSPGKAYKCYRVHPDESSYATVLHAAASAGNRAMVNDLWTEMKQEGIAPNRYAYNALMKAICNEGSEFDEEAINLLDHMKRNPFLQPDRFTIDLVLLPMVRTEGVERICDLIQDFAYSQRSQPALLAQAFSSFLNTLVKADEVDAAHFVFDTFLLPQLERPRDPNAGARFSNVRHFNIVLNGLRNTISRSKDLISKQDIRKESARLYQTMLRARIRPDEYTLTILMGTVKSSSEIMSILRSAVVDMGVDVTPVVLRSILAACGDVNDASSACWLFDTFKGGINDAKTWNALIGSLADCAVFDSCSRLNVASSEAAVTLSQDFAVVGQSKQATIASVLDGRTCPAAAMLLLKIMNKKVEAPFVAPRPNTQTYCLVASNVQHEASDPVVAMELFRDASDANIPADGRFVNAVLRCFGDDIEGALDAWKGGIRKACLAAEAQASPKTQRSTAKHLLAAYQGLLYVCGRALRPDIALRIVYAMNKEGVLVNEMALQCFQAGKRKGLAEAENDATPRKKAIAFGEQIESLLAVECTKYDTKDKRREGDKRVRIIL